MAARCAEYWLPVMKKHGIVPTWGGKYEQVSLVAQDGSISEDEEDEDGDLGNRSDEGELNIEDILDFE